MRQNRNSNKKSLSKNLKYMKTFESFEGDYQLMLEEESLLSKFMLGLGILGQGLFGSPQDVKAADIVTKDAITYNIQTEEGEETKLVTAISKEDTSTIKTFVTTPKVKLGVKFNLIVEGFKDVDDIEIQELQQDRYSFDEPVIVCEYSTNRLVGTTKYPVEAAIPKFISANEKDGTVNIKLLNNGIDPKKMVIKVIVFKEPIINQKGEVVKPKTEWTINGKSFNELNVESERSTPNNTIYLLDDFQ
jgi:hypothetical protein